VTKMAYALLLLGFLFTSSSLDFSTDVIVETSLFGEFGEGCASPLEPTSVPVRRDSGGGGGR